jgi:acylphosphatase
MDKKQAAFHALVSGKVQGVGFRYSALQEAEQLGINGWVRNTPDRDVEVWAEGLPEKLELFLAWLRRGPEYSRVDSVKKTDAAAQGYSGFEVKY